MTWFWFAVITLLCWSGSDFFSKLGCRDGKDKYSQFKMVMAVGLVMGIHALYEIINGTEISWQVMLTYLPVSLLYIGSMALGYVGLRYIELSADGPIRPPYAVYFQGGLTWYHAKLGILMSLQKMVDAGIVTL